MDCLNPDTVSYEEFKDRLENIEKANEAVGIKWHTDTRNRFYSQDNREDHQKDRWKKNTNRNYRNNNRSQSKNKNYNYGCNNHNKQCIQSNSISPKEKAKPKDYKLSTKNTKQDKQDSGKKTYSTGVKQYSQAELDNMRAKGQCFICKQLTHLAKDCPTHSIVRLDNAPRVSLSSKSVNINYSALDKLTDTLEDNNYLDLDLIADNTIDPLSSSTCIHSMAIQLPHSDDNYVFSTLWNKNYNSLAGYQTILQVFGIERLDLRL